MSISVLKSIVKVVKNFYINITFINNKTIILLYGNFVKYIIVYLYIQILIIVISSFSGFHF